jgi:hypothetical protein
VSDTSWLANLNFAMQPNNLGVSFNPYEMRSKAIDA